jgi:hypothetical protein
MPLQLEEKILTESIKKNIGYHLKNKCCPNYMITQVVVFLESFRFL